MCWSAGLTGLHLDTFLGLGLGECRYDEVLKQAGWLPRDDFLEVSFGSVDPFGHEAAELYEKACSMAVYDGKQVRAILLCSPNNPLGSSVLRLRLHLEGY